MHRKVLPSFRHAFRGIRTAWADGWNFRIHILCAVILIFIMIYFGFSYLEWAVLLGMATIVLCGELMNTVVEKMLDIVEPGHHPLVGKIKDMAAGGVLLASAGALAMGVFVFVHHFLTQ